MAPVSTNQIANPGLSADYKYIFVDTLSDAVLAELPLVNVSFTNSLNDAGTFSGNLSITSDTINSDLYNATLPGKSSLYVLRNNVCVWGGIVSTRIYDIGTRTLAVTADEFVSYLDRRFMWKTLSETKACKIEIRQDPNTVEERLIGTVTLTGSDTVPSGFAVGTWVSLYFGESLDEYNGAFRVLDDANFPVTSNSFSFAAYYRPSSKTNFAPMKESNIDASVGQVTFRQKTDDFLENLLIDHFANDTQNLTITNEISQPAELLRYQVVAAGKANGIATVELSTETGPHYLVEGQVVAVRDLPSLSTSKTRVESIIDDYTFTYPYSGNTIPFANVTLTPVSVSHWQRVNDYLTITTSSAHNLEAGDVIQFSGLSVAVDSKAYYYVNNLSNQSGTANTQTVFQVYNPGRTVRYSNVSNTSATVTRIPVVEISTAGSFGENADIGITFNTNANLVGKLSDTNLIRGFELKSFKEIIDTYALDADGFDYRIDVSYDANTDTFSKEFKFLPLRPEGLSDVSTLGANELASISDFGADRLVFEYPGNINSIALTETIEGGGTRVWIQGSLQDDLSAEAEQPYGARADHDWLGGETADGRRWPIFDMKIVNDKVYNPKDIKNLADQLVSQAQLPISNFEITVNGTIDPIVGTYKPGDWCIVSCNDAFVEQRLGSYYENKGDTNRTVLLRKIASISVNLASNPILPEEVVLELVTEPSVDVSGAESWRV